MQDLFLVETVNTWSLNVASSWTGAGETAREIQNYVGRMCEGQLSVVRGEEERARDQRLGIRGLRGQVESFENYYLIFENCSLVTSARVWLEIEPLNYQISNIN